jgi:aspartyl-tRNA(Asn)/glutamyl-tRNA(Gln) amidotransferase subunit B
MEEGSMRCEPNISIRPKGQEEFGTKTEIKNLNSFRAVYLGVAYEIKRQERVLREGGVIVQETRRWDDSAGKTATMRTKEFEQEYRYFPDPDLVPMRFTDDWIGGLSAEIPELPAAKIRRFVDGYGIPQADAEVLADTIELADYYEAAAKGAKDSRAVANWITGEFLRLINATGTAIADTKVSPEGVRALLDMIDKGTINRNTAKSVFEEMFTSGMSAEEIVKAKGLEQVTDSGEIESMVDAVLAKHSDEVARFKGGEDRLLGFFVGQVMREAKGKANPAVVNELLRKKLG